jgi:crotonobetainyl-CoA:carnitine CoA-transferase CaiB-like acyl-CoA transferase
LALFQGEDVAVGPVATLAEASQDFGGSAPNDAPPPLLGEHTAQWRKELGLA